MPQRHLPIYKQRPRPKKTKKEQTPRKSPTWLRKLKLFAYKVVRFLTSDMWHIQPDEVRGFRRLYINTLKALYMAIKGYMDQRLSRHASALTYRTFLSIVPMLALLVAFAKGLPLIHI